MFAYRDRLLPIRPTWRVWASMPLWICHRLTAQSFKSTYVLASERMRALIPTLFLNRGGDRSASQGAGAAAAAV